MDLREFIFPLLFKCTLRSKLSVVVHHALGSTRQTQAVRAVRKKPFGNIVEKGKKMVTRISPFSELVFYPIRDRNPQFHQFLTVICKCVHLGLVQNLIVSERLKYQDFLRFDQDLNVYDPEDSFWGFFNRVISVISVVLRETTLTISVSTGIPVSRQSEIMKSDFP